MDQFKLTHYPNSGDDGHIQGGYDECPALGNDWLRAIVALIGHTTTATVLRARPKLDKRRYATGGAVTRAEMRALTLHPHAVPW